MTFDHDIGQLLAVAVLQVHAVAEGINCEAVKDLSVVDIICVTWEFQITPQLVRKTVGVIHHVDLNAELVLDQVLRDVTALLEMPWCRPQDEDGAVEALLYSRDEVH